MKFNLDKAILDKVIAKLGRILTANSSIPILNGVLITVTNDYIGFTTSNGVESILVREVKDSENGVDILETGAAVLPREIFNLTKKMKAGTIEFATNEDCTQINVKQKRTKIDFSIEQADQYPRIDSNSQPTGHFKLPAEEFEKIVKTTDFAAAKSEVRPVLTGIHFTLGAGENGLTYKAVSTDSHRLAQICSPNPLAKEVVSLTVPAQSLTQAIKSFDLKGDVAIVTYPNQIALLNGNTIIYTNLLEGNYPQTDRLIPESNSVLVLDRQEMIDALELLSVMKDKERGANTKLTVGETSVLLEANAGTSRTQQEIPVISNENVEVNFTTTFSVEYALDALRALHTKHVRIELNGAMRPFIFRNVYEADASKELNSLQLVLPIRTY